MSNLGTIYAQQGRFLDAQPLFSRLLLLGDVEGSLNLATVYFFQDRMKLAAEAYKRVLAIEPENVVAQDALGETYEALGEIESAKMWYAKAMSSYDAELATGVAEPAWMTGRRAVLVAKFGRHEEATAITNKLVNESPEDPERLYFATQVCALSKDETGLLELTERALRAGFWREHFKRAPEFSAYQDHPEFSALLLSDSLEEQE